MNNIESSPPEDSIQILRKKIEYLEAKVNFLKSHAAMLLGAGGAPGGRGSESLLETIDYERKRSARLAEEVLELRAHRDDVVRQIEHQSAHVLFLTRKIEMMEASRFPIGQKLRMLLLRPRSHDTAG